MVLTQSQKNQLHKDLLEYLANNNFPKTAQFATRELKEVMKDGFIGGLGFIRVLYESK